MIKAIEVPEEDEEMLQAAHASMYFWKLVGTAGNRAHAAQLVAVAQHLHHARLHGGLRPALGQRDRLARQRHAEPRRRLRVHCRQDRGCEPWEKACAFAVKASVAAASGQPEVHASSYSEAARLIAALPDPEDREILYATLRVVPKPGGV